ncbi:MAG: disulfide bond chaperone [Verrucomicrobia bacterium]|nr:disulfide bond chaperone [Verrucomicrobiota bacterium]
MELPDEQTPLEVRSYFVRGRNALVTRAQMGDLYLDYYLHQGQHGYQHQMKHDAMLKEALAALVLYAASRPWNEVAAWTIHFEAEAVNLFVTADNPRGQIVGQIFTEQVKQTGHNLFCADIVRGNQPPGRSFVEFEGGSVKNAVEWFYTQSEQRTARFFEVAPEDYVMVSAQPDCEEGWIESLSLENVQQLDRLETVSLLERRAYHWRCSCDEKRMLDILTPVLLMDPEGLFGEESSIRMACPRCGARYVISREAMEAHAASRK